MIKNAPYVSKMKNPLSMIPVRRLSFIIFGVGFLMMSCSQQQKKDDSQMEIEAVEEYSATPLDIQTADSMRSDTVPQNNGVGGASANQPVTDAYDDGYLDGEAMAEEDRMAGHPGMQVGMDDDEEDYEEGYDDGYDE